MKFIQLVGGALYNMWVFIKCAVPSHNVRASALPISVRLGWKVFPCVNTLAYFRRKSHRRRQKSFLTLTKGCILNGQTFNWSEIVKRWHRVMEASDKNNKTRKDLWKVSNDFGEDLSKNFLSNLYKNLLRLKYFKRYLRNFFMA